MKCGIVLGTRPEIIKLAPVIWLLRQSSLPYAVIHTGQHYSYEMDTSFFETLELDPPDVNLATGADGASHGVQTGAMFGQLEAAFADLAVDRVLVHGDTNSTLAGALVGAKLNLPVGHVEAGLRSFDRTMPEEVNRVVADHVASQLYAPTQAAMANLAREGLSGTLCGNTIVDTIEAMRERLSLRADWQRLGLMPGEYMFLTLHRQENVDNSARLASIVAGLSLIAQRIQLPIVFSMHYRTRDRLQRTGLLGKLADIPRLTVLHPPIGLLESLALQSEARLVLTDSGGLQEEACVLGTPCVTLRENTERPETLEIGANVLGGYRPQTMLAAVEAMLDRRGCWPNPFGDGRAAARCVAAIMARPDLNPGELVLPVIGGV